MLQRTALIVIALAALIAATAVADDQVADKRTRQVVRELTDYFSALDSFTVDASVDMSVSLGQQSQISTSRFSFAMRRPDRFAMHMTGGDRGGSFVTNGERLWTYAPSAGRYSVETAPQPFEAALGHEVLGALSAGAGDFVALLGRSDAYEAVFDGVGKAEYIGAEKLGDTGAHHLWFERDDVGLNLWVARGDQPVVLKVAPDFSAAQPAEPGPRKIELTITFSDWRPNVEIEPATFTFTPPDGAERVASLLGHPMLAKPAPGFTLADLDGEKHSLADHKGKDIVILDFWATWCGWCGKAMPVLEQVAAKFKDKNVVLYAVNVREDAAAARQYMNQRNLNADHVLLDKTASAADSFGVQGLPTTAIIGTDGTVQAIFSGVPGGSERLLAEQMTNALETLTSGEKLAELD